MIKFLYINVVDYIVRYVIYFCLILGSWLFAFPLIKPMLTKNNKFRKIKVKREKKNGIERHIQNIIEVVFNSNTGFSVYTFYVVSGLLFLFSFLLFNSIGQTLFVKIGISIFIAFLPYFLLRIRLYSIQVESSYEGDELLGEISNQYKINYFNMHEAILKTVLKLKRSPYTKRALFRLANQLPQYKNLEELQVLIEKFTFSIGTEWAILLGNNMFISLTSEDVVTEALDDIFDDLKDLNSINEKNKQQNHESFSMIVFVVPLSYIISIFIMFKYFAFNVSKFIDYQFKDAMGSKFFILTFMFMIINFMVFLIIRKPKNDF